MDFTYHEIQVFIGISPLLQTVSPLALEPHQNRPWSRFDPCTPQLPISAWFHSSQVGILPSINHSRQVQRSSYPAFHNEAGNWSASGRLSPSTVSCLLPLQPAPRPPYVREPLHPTQTAGFPLAVEMSPVFTCHIVGTRLSRILSLDYNSDAPKASSPVFQVTVSGPDEPI